MSSKVTEKMSLSPAQCRAARALLNWSQAQLAETSTVAIKTIADFERGSRAPYDRTLADLQRALESAGVEFIVENGGGPGVRLRKPVTALDADIKDAQERTEAKIPAGPSPASGMAQLRRGLAENDLRTLKEKKRRGRPPQKGGNDSDPNAPR